MSFQNIQQMHNNYLGHSQKQKLKDSDLFNTVFTMHFQ